MKHITYSLPALFRMLCAGLIFLCAGSACSPDVPLVSLGLEEVYYLPRMKSYRLVPALTGESYRWMMKTAAGSDSLLSTDREYLFLEGTEGSYELTFEVWNSGSVYAHLFRMVVVHEEIEYSPYISKVYEYRPAPGQFVNQIPLYENGDTEEDMRRKAEESLSGDSMAVLVSLGAYGGYLTFGFDHTVMNVEGKKDFKIFGNTFYTGGGGAEPGIVMVAYDTNRNGRPDPEEWYELAGSEYHKATTIKGYEIVYRRPDPDKLPVPGQGVVDATYIAWTDNRDGSGYVEKNATHSQSYYPQWLDDEELVFTGTLLPPNAEDVSGNGSNYILHPYAWGYTDNHLNTTPDLISFDIGWAVDKEGNPVSLPGVDFIRVYTGINQTCGRLGETSTEIQGACDLHLE